MYCKKCGKEIADDSKFCQHCGFQIEESKKSHRLSKIDWIAILVGLLWVAYWTKEAIAVYTNELSEKWLYATYLKDIHNEAVPASMIKSEALGASISYFLLYCIIPLLLAIVIYIIAPVFYKKFQERKSLKAK